ncbi:heptosyltransferase II [Ardenticatena maritima]|uniref:Heptosyltransferase II n=2 Tax=Ardenticatena maritima TaxID=872965 RepID=A0A0M8K574_9CHLR|nr:heptosyltransferase II [Ardenticatena maritima]
MVEMRRLLVVKPADLGDLLFVTPALRALRETFPHARIDLFAPPRSAFLLRDCPYVDEIVAFDKYAFDDPRALLSPRGWWALARLAWDLRRRRYDALVIPRHLTTALGALKFAALALASGAPIRAGLDNGRGWFLTHRVPDEGFGARHEVEYDLAVVATLGARTRDHRLWLPCDERAEAWAEALVQHWARPLVVMHPGSGAYSTARRWPAEHFAALADAWYARHGGTVALVDATADITSVVCTHAQAPLVDLGGRTTLLQTIALLRRADLFVGNDSGPLHLAAAAGVPVVGVYGPSNWRAWGPWGAHTAVVHRDLPCQPCFYRGHSLGLPDGCPDRPCLTGLAPERVLAVMEQMAKR